MGRPAYGVRGMNLDKGDYIVGMATTAKDAKQAELAFNSFNARREHQFKITLGLWALLILTTQFVLVKLHNRPSLLLCVRGAGGSVQGECGSEYGSECGSGRRWGGAACRAKARAGGRACMRLSLRQTGSHAKVLRPLREA